MSTRAGISGGDQDEGLGFVVGGPQEQTLGKDSVQMVYYGGEVSSITAPNDVHFPSQEAVTLLHDRAKGTL